MWTYATSVCGLKLLVYEGGPAVAHVVASPLAQGSLKALLRLSSGSLKEDPLLLMSWPARLLKALLRLS